MCKQLKVLASEAIRSVKPFMSAKQLSGLIENCAGRKGEFYMRSLVDFRVLVTSLPRLEDSPVNKCQVVYLRYLCGVTHWYVAGVSADLLPGGRMVRAFVDNHTRQLQDCGLILLPGLFRFGVDTTLDLFFEPCPLASLEARVSA